MVATTYVIPKGTHARQCRGCQQYIYFVATESRKMMPVSVVADDLRIKAPTATEDGLGVSHFGNCPGADRFRGPR